MRCLAVHQDKRRHFQTWQGWQELHLVAQFRRQKQHQRVARLWKCWYKYAMKRRQQKQLWTALEKTEVQAKPYAKQPLHMRSVYVKSSQLLADAQEKREWMHQVVAAWKEASSMNKAA